MLGAILAVMAIAAAQSWNRWLDPIIDTGRDLYIAERLGEGARLYRDIRYEYPPLAPYLLAAITRMTGSSLAGFALIGLGQSIAIAALLLLIAAKFAGRRAGFAAALLFAALNFCGASTHGANFVFPYTYAATFGMLFLLGVVAAAAWGWPRLAVLAALAASWCKVEYCIAALLVVIALTAARKLRVRDLIAMIAALITSVFVAANVFGGAAMRANLFAPSLTHGAVARRFYSVVAGTADWQANALDGLLGLAAIAAIVLLLNRNWSIAAAVVAVALGVCLHVPSFFRAWGLLQWPILGYAIVRRERGWLLVLAIFSIASTLRIPWNVTPIWYGFVLVLPVYLLIAFVLFHELPSRGVYRRELATIWLLLFGGFAIRALFEQHQYFAAKPYRIESRRGTFYDRSPALAALLPQLDGKSLVVFPEGIAINHLAGIPTPISFHTFTPPEMSDDAEREVLRELEAHPPELIVIVPRDVREYGRRAFGIDYDQRIAAWIGGHYRTVSRSSIELLHRK